MTPMKTALAILLLSTYSLAQEPQAPMNPSPAPQRLVVLRNPVLPQATASPYQEKVITKSFIAWTVADGATIAADALTTVHCLNKPNCIETNPLFGRHPSTQRVAFTESGFFATDTLVSYLLKRKGKSWWWVPSLVNTAQGGIAAGLNLRFR